MIEVKQYSSSKETWIVERGGQASGGVSNARLCQRRRGLPARETKWLSKERDQHLAELSPPDIECMRPLKLDLGLNVLWNFKQ